MKIMELNLMDGAKQLPPPPNFPETTTSHIMLTMQKVSDEWSEATASASNCHR